MKLKNSPAPAIFILGVLYFIFGSTACQNYEMKENVQKIDSLQSMLKTAGEILIFDEATIKDRADSIVIKSEYLRKNYHRFHDTVGWEFQTLTTKYRGIRKNYQYFVKNYPVLLYDHEKHEKRIADLRQDVLDRNLSQNEFNNIYPSERVLIQKHLERVKSIAQSVYSIEGDYQRTNKEITDTYNDIKKRLKE